MKDYEFNLQGISQNESPENLLGSKPFGELFGTRLFFNPQPLLHETETPKHLQFSMNSPSFGFFYTPANYIFNLKKSTQIQNKNRQKKQ